jgi:hypothetical protein
MRPCATLLLAALAACNSETPTSHGASGGDAAADRRVSVGDSGGGSTPDMELGCPTLPPCFLELFQGCLRMGGCAEEGPRTCYANGVTSQSVPSMLPVINSTRVFKPDGSLCYSKDTLINEGAAGATLMWTYKDASGAPVVTGNVNSKGESVFACASGPTVTTNFACQRAAEGGLDEPCFPGTCK